jgi:transcriptional regulator with XRE-family HTH domain
MQDRVNQNAGIYGILVKQVSEMTKARGMSQPDLASESGIAEERLTSILRGQSRDVTLRELVGLSLALGVPLAALLADL